jgi:potassium-transporting ATPase ATP-binding subunit
MASTADVAGQTPVLDSNSQLSPKLNRAGSLFDRATLGRSLRDSVLKLNPLSLWKRPVIFAVEIAAAVVTLLVCRDIVTGRNTIGFEAQVALWLWLTVLGANFAESAAQARGKALADSLRRTKADAMAKRLAGKRIEHVATSKLRAGDIVLAQPGDLIPGDGEVIQGIATIDESVITGESAPVIRESGGDRSAVTGGTRVLSDEIKIRITSNAGESFLERMIALVEGFDRQKTPSEMALETLIAGLTLLFLISVAALYPFVSYVRGSSGVDGAPLVPMLVALFVCLTPTTIGGLLSAVGIAGMDRLMRDNVLAMSGKAVEAAANIDTLLLDKTGTITLGNREAVDFIPFPGVTEEELAAAARLASLADETPEGRSIVALAKEKYGVEDDGKADQVKAAFVPFSAYTRMSGVDLDGRTLRKGATEAVAHFVKERGGTLPESFHEISDGIARAGGTPLALSDGGRALGIIHLKDIVKRGMKERMHALHQMGIRAVMITGDNPLTTAAIAAEAAVDDFLAQATPADKLTFIKKEQSEGRLVAMTGDGTNDAPALAQADVGVAMNTGTTTAKEAGNMVDLDSDPTKLIEIVANAKQLLMTRGALMTFSMANDVAVSFVIIPALFASAYPVLSRLNLLGLPSPESAVLSALIFNALIIPALIPLALRGVKCRTLGTAASLLRRNLLIYAAGGVLIPFPAIWLIDHLLVGLKLV